MVVCKDHAGSSKREVVRRDFRSEIVRAKPVPYKNDDFPYTRTRVLPLRICGERPRRCATEKCDKIASSQSIELHPNLHEECGQEYRIGNIKDFATDLRAKIGVTTRAVPTQAAQKARKVAPRKTLTGAPAKRAVMMR